MSWLDYYRLLERYDGDLDKASRRELASAARGNPNDPPSALRLARQKWQEALNELSAQPGKLSQTPVERE